MQRHNGVALSHIDVRHLAAEDSLSMLLVGKCCRDHVLVTFLDCGTLTPNGEELIKAAVARDLAPSSP